MAKTIKQTEERVAEVKRRAEEAVSDVKRQAVIELQKAVRAAEEKANEAVAGAHVKMEKAVLEARRAATEETMANSNVQTDSSEVRVLFILLSWLLFFLPCIYSFDVLIHSLVYSIFHLLLYLMFIF